MIFSRLLLFKKRNFDREMNEKSYQVNRYNWADVSQSK